MHNLVVLFNKILDSFAEGNEFLQRCVICLKSIELNKGKVNEIEKGGKDSLKKFWVALACWIRREKKEKQKEIIRNKWNEEIGNGIWKVKLWIS